MLLDREKTLSAFHGETRSVREKLLICLANLGDGGHTVADIREQAKQFGVKQITKVNISQELARAAGKAVRTAGGWELLPQHKNTILEELSAQSETPTKQAASALRSILNRMPLPETQSFLTEAVSCCEYGLYRAAVVLSWVGAVHLLQSAVLSSTIYSPLFNAEAAKRSPKWKAASKPEDISTQLKEGDFLDILQGIGFIDSSVKKQLKASLDLRNSCGHPNTFSLAEHTVHAHVEVLMLNVFMRY